MLPDFIIVGAMKSGTSTLAYHLRQHPSIYMPKRELHFFDAQGGYADRWERGAKWYEKQFEDAEPTDLRGEKTPTYAYLPSVSERVHSVVPEVSLLWIFRNPVDRAYSNYWHAVRSGGEWLSFEEAVRRESERVKEDIWKGYVRRSQYVEQVERFLEYFDREAMHFCLLEDLKQDPGSVLNNVCSFLGLDRGQLDLGAHDRRKNVTRAPRSIRARYLRERLEDIPLLGSLFFRLEHAFNRRRRPGYPQMDSELRARLKRHFEPYNQRLEERVDLDVSAWQS